LLNNDLFFRLAKIDPGDFLNMNQAFSGTPALPFPGAGLGAVLSLMPTDNFYFTAGFVDANGQKISAGFDTSSQEGEFFTGAEIGLTPTFKGLGTGKYRFTGWHIDQRTNAGLPCGQGFALSFNQEVGGGFVPFLRYNFADGGGADVRHLLAAGVGIEHPLGRSDALAGVAFAWGEPQNRSLRDQYVCEAFYRIQAFPNIQLTPGYQVIINPSRNPDQAPVGVFEIRFRLLF
jgi:carbohydrate-selective porin OprB